MEGEGIQVSFLKINKFELQCRDPTRDVMQNIDDSYHLTKVPQMMGNSIPFSNFVRESFMQCHLRVVTKEGKRLSKEHTIAYLSDKYND